VIAHSQFSKSASFAKDTFLVSRVRVALLFRGAVLLELKSNERTTLVIESATRPVTVMHIDSLQRKAWIVRPGWESDLLRVGDVARWPTLRAEFKEFIREMEAARKRDSKTDMLQLEAAFARALEWLVEMRLGNGAAAAPNDELRVLVPVPIRNKDGYVLHRAAPIWSRCEIVECLAWFHAKPDGNFTLGLIPSELEEGPGLLFSDVEVKLYRSEVTVYLTAAILDDGSVLLLVADHHPNLVGVERSCAVYVESPGAKQGMCVWLTFDPNAHSWTAHRASAGVDAFLNLGSDMTGVQYTAAFRTAARDAVRALPNSDFSLDRAFGSMAINDSSNGGAAAQQLPRDEKLSSAEDGSDVPDSHAAVASHSYGSSPLLSPRAAHSAASSTSMDITSTSSSFSPAAAAAVVATAAAAPASPASLHPDRSTSMLLWLESLNMKNAVSYAGAFRSEEIVTLGDLLDFGSRLSEDEQREWLTESIAVSNVDRERIVKKCSALREAAAAAGPGGHRVAISVARSGASSAAFAPPAAATRPAVAAAAVPPVAAVATAAATAAAADFPSRRHASKRAKTAQFGVASAATAAAAAVAASRPKRGRSPTAGTTDASDSEQDK